MSHTVKTHLKNNKAHRYLALTITTYLQGVLPCLLGARVKMSPAMACAAPEDSQLEAACPEPWEHGKLGLEYSLPDLHSSQK